MDGRTGALVGCLRCSDGLRPRVRDYYEEGDDGSAVTGLSGQELNAHTDPRNPQVARNVSSRSVSQLFLHISTLTASDLFMQNPGSVYCSPPVLVVASVWKPLCLNVPFGP